MSGALGLDRSRWSTHGAMLAVTVAGYFVSVPLLDPGIGFVHRATIALGYVALFQLALTLLIGPWRLLRRGRRNPLNIDLRRDIGIWAAVTGTLHVIFGFQVHLNGQVLRYFFRRNSWVPLDNLFGVSNDLGLAAGVLLLLLLLLSNDVSLRWLKGKMWKRLQRSNYFVFGLVLLHTLGYQVVIERPRAMAAVVAALSVLVLGLQVRGFRSSRRGRP